MKPVEVIPTKAPAIVTSGRGRLCVFSICWNEAQMLPWFLLHYSAFADRIVIFDEQSTDGSREIIKQYPKAQIREWPHKGLDDEKFLEAVNSYWLEARGKYEWVMWPDIDELLHHHRPTDALDRAGGDVIQAEGWALISPSGWPQFGGGQLYESVRTGIRQENYDKQIIWRSNINMTHTIGRHTYPGQFPKTTGRIAPSNGWRLLHCHHVGGVEDTSAKNQRNFDRAVNKKFAWNYDASHNTAKQNGSVEWVKDSMGKLKDIFVPDGKKVHLGSGGQNLIGWENHDMDVDIRSPLPYAPNSLAYIFIEHCVEHVTHKEAWRFFEECYRVLAPGGALRVAIPDIKRMAKRMTDEYAQAVKKGGHGDGSHRAAVKAAVFEHGHQAAWDVDLLETVLATIGFNTRQCEPGQSEDPALHDIEQHWKVVGRSVAEVETSVVEGIKP